MPKELVVERYSMSLDFSLDLVHLATQVSALVGTSLILYLVTTPRAKEEVLLADQNTPVALEGMKKYSSYHRQRFHSMDSQ